MCPTQKDVGNFPGLYINTKRATVLLSKKNGRYGLA